MNKIIKGLLVIVAIIVIVFVVYGVALNKISNSMCREECNEMNALAHEIHPSGNFKLDDVCVCYGNDWVKTWRMGE